MAQQTAQQAQGGSLFGLPGITRNFETRENNWGASWNTSSSNIVPATGIIPFKQTDIVKGWDMQVAWANTTAAGTQTLTASPYFPYNVIGAFSLNFQNQFDSIRAPSGVDLAIWQALRPMRGTDFKNGLYTNANKALPYSGTATAPSASNYTPTSTGINFRLELPAAVLFDRYYSLAADGSILSTQPIRTHVSPQYMAGTSRIVAPNMVLNPTLGTNADLTPIVTSGSNTTPATSTGTITANIYRRGWFQPQGPADSPAVWNWQYTRRAQQYAIGAVSSKDILVPLNGQIMSLYVRLFDPTANAPVALSSVKECDFTFGTGLYRYQDTPTDNVARVISQHGFTLPEGVLAFDFATADDGLISNADLPNTMNTSAIQVHIDFTGTQSSTCYAVVGVEALTYVEAA